MACGMSADGRIIAPSAASNAMTMIPIDLSALSPAARKVLDPVSPPAMRTLAARAVVPGVRPDELVSVVAAIAAGGDGDLAAVAQKTLASLPAPVLTSALAGDLDPGVIDLLAGLYLADLQVMERLLAMPRVAPETIADIAGRCGEQLAEILATNEQRLLAHPRIIERLYMNRAVRMSTADRIVELAIRNGLELTGIAAFEQLKAAIEGQAAEPKKPVAPATAAEAAASAPTASDVAFMEVLALGDELDFDPSFADTYVVTDKGTEEVDTKFVPLYARLAGMTIAQKIRIASLGSSGERLLLMRDTNRLVAVAAIRSPLVQGAEIVRISQSRVVSDDVLREIARNKDWIRDYQIKLNLVMNPRVPMGVSSRLIGFLRESELKTISKSKNVSGPVATLAKQQLNRRAK